MKVDRATFQTWIVSLACHSGVDRREASSLAEVLVWSDMIGRPEQGVWRLPTYLKRFKLGLISSPSRPRMIARKKAVALLDGRNGFGQVVGQLAMDQAIRLAEKFGVGVVGVKRSNHFGPAAYFVNQAAEKGYLGLAFSNAAPRVAPAGYAAPLLGTNPIALGAPRRGARPLLIDLSTSASAGSKVRWASEAGEALSSGIARDAQGRAVSDAHAAVAGILEPVGGAKGFALGIMVEILSGVITGAAISREVASIYEDFSRPNSVGHLFVSLDVEAFMPRDAYFDRTETLAGFIQSAEQISSSFKPVVPGDRRWSIYDRHAADGLELDERTYDALCAMGRKLRVAAPW
jgi:LDH2 family malate/lactate/ureidoglycolate dehydrogenase